MIWVYLYTEKLIFIEVHPGLILQVIWNDLETSSICCRNFYGASPQHNAKRVKPKLNSVIRVLDIF